MPSPFPGMDPYLENPGLWSDFHLALLGRIRASLNAVLPERYVAVIDQYVWLEEEDAEERVRDGAPDAYISDYETPSSGAVATLSAPAYVTLTTPTRASRFVRITDQQHQRVITVMELLSPSNKSGADREAYLHKRGNYLATGVNLVEFDLLRAGEPLPLGQPRPTLRDYYALVHSSRHPRAGFWAFGVRDPIPTVPIPLDPSDAPIQFDLRSCLDQTYDEGRCRRKIDYTQPPTPRLTEPDATWARELLASHTQQGNAT